ncbi:hypothetical protein GCM10027262_53050 [Nocardia tengchongensis]
MVRGRLRAPRTDDDECVDPRKRPAGKRIHRLRDRRHLTKVGLGHKLDQYPDGLDHTIGEGGRLLSGGEKQRLSLARALIAGPRILFLDEASSALDSDTEAKILTSLRALADETTIIAITHRTDTITTADNMIDLTPAAIRT